MIGQGGRVPASINGIGNNKLLRAIRTAIIILSHLFVSMSMYESVGNRKVSEPYLYIGFERCLLIWPISFFFLFPSSQLRWFQKTLKTGSPNGVCGCSWSLSFLVIGLKDRRGQKCACADFLSGDLRFPGGLHIWHLQVKKYSHLCRRTASSKICMPSYIWTFHPNSFFANRADKKLKNSKFRKTSYIEVPLSLLSRCQIDLRLSSSLFCHRRAAANEFCPGEHTTRKNCPKHAIFVHLAVSLFMKRRHSFWNWRFPSLKILSFSDIMTQHCYSSRYTFTYCYVFQDG